MTTLTSMTLAQLRASTKAQIITGVSDYLSANFTKKQLIQLLRERDTEWDDPVWTYVSTTKGLQYESKTEIERDCETGAQVSKRVTTWDYYNSGEVNVILIIVYDANNVEKKRKRIKHARTGGVEDVTGAALL
jgi:hypothetical protein